jgi:hypothetical protein
VRSEQTNWLPQLAALAPLGVASKVFVGGETLNKACNGHVIGVRYDKARKHVYMRTPVVVLAAGT